MGYVFISYSSKKQQMADSFRTLLNQNGIETWMAPGDIPFGSTYMATINRAIKDSSCFMLLLSESAQESQWVLKETERAVNSAKTIFPVLLDDVPMNDSFEFMLSSSQAVAIRKIDENDEKIKKLLKDIKALTNEEETTQSEDFVTEDGVLIKYNGTSDNVVIPDGVITIGEMCFGNAKIKSITIPDSVKSIGRDAFKNCTELTSITIPNSVTKIGNSAFKNCVCLASITIADNIISIGRYAFNHTGYYNNKSNWKDDVLYIGKYLISAKKTISGEYTIKSGTKTIAADAFKGCDDLTSITIPDSVTRIGNFAFENCTGLTSIMIANNIENIGGYAFCNTGYYNDKSNWKDGVLYIGKYLISAKKTISGEYTIKSGTKTIAVRAFGDCDGLTNIDIPDSVTHFGSYAFENCTGLTSIVIPNSVISIGSHVFFGCTDLASITIPNSVASIGEFAFFGCAVLTNITIPNSVTCIGEDLFSHSLSEVYVECDENSCAYMYCQENNIKNSVDNPHHSPKG